MGEFTGKVVAVTGAAGVIGRRCLERFVEESAVVVGIDLQPAEIAGAHWLVADLASAASIAETFQAIKVRFGGIDVLVQSAAVLRRVGFLDLTADDIDFMYAINVRAVLLGGQEAARMMIEQGGGGAVINIGSVASNASDAVSVGYDASKGGVRSATRGMAVALAPHGIRVVEVAPGPMAAPQGMPAREASDIDGYVRRRIPLGRWGLPDDVAGAVLFAASGAAGYLTGSTLHIDGGLAAAF